MSSLTASRLLAAWEQGAGQIPLERAYALLAVAFPAEDRSLLIDLDVAERDAKLLELHELLFGGRMEGLADCPACQERVEMSFQASELIASQARQPGPSEYQLERDGHWVHFRLPASRDLYMAMAEPPDRRRRSLAERCILETRPGEPAQLPEAVITAMSERMAEVAPLADVWFALTCPACGHQWQAPFDIASYLWAEVEAWSYRTLQEVHSLARAYGWSEAEILGLSAWRRQFYLSLL
jgi:hypothetical protein